MTGKPVDLITLQNRLNEKDVPPEISSHGVCQEICSTSALTSANVRCLCTILYSEKAVLRKLIKVN